jgi:hypothetical protein
MTERGWSTATTCREARPWVFGTSASKRAEFSCIPSGKALEVEPCFPYDPGILHCEDKRVYGEMAFGLERCVREMKEKITT